MRMEIWISQTLMVIYSSCWPWLRPPILALFRVPRPSRLQYGTAKITVFVTGGSKVSLESPALLSHLDALWLSMSPFPLLQSVLEVALMTLKTLVQCPTDRSRSIQQAKVTKLRLSQSVFFWSFIWSTWTHRLTWPSSVLWSFRMFFSPLFPALKTKLFRLWVNRNRLPSVNNYFLPIVLIYIYILIYTGIQLWDMLFSSQRSDLKTRQ